MNPVLILLAILIFSNRRSSPHYIKGPQVRNHSFISKSMAPASSDVNFFDTFKMELLLDRMHSVTDTLERINHLNQMRNVPLTKDNVIDRIQESLDAVKGFLVDQKSTSQIDSISSTLAGVKRLGSIENIISSMGPVLSLLGNMGEDSNENSTR